MVDVLLGLQWGDEGKGKVVDFLGDKYQMVARFQGGPNAGHSLKIGDLSIVLNMIPSGIFRETCQNLIGNGVVIDPAKLIVEIKKVADAGAPVSDNLFIARKAHLITPGHILLDAASEKFKGEGKIGSTLRGISPTYQDKIGRSGLRIGDIFQAGFDKKYEALKMRHEQIAAHFGADPKVDPAAEKAFFEAIDQMRKLRIVDADYFVNDILAEGKHVLAEGAQGSMLDIDFGTYPYVTSSNTISGGACTGLGVAPQKIRHVYGVFKAYCTRVGSGPFPTELDNDKGDEIRQKGHEFGATTGRPRRTGWIDLPALRYAIMLNGVTHLMMTKADVLCDMPTISVGMAYKTPDGVINRIPYDFSDTEIEPVYEQVQGWDASLHQAMNYDAFPKSFQNYIQFLSDRLGLPLAIISTGPEREKTFRMQGF